uniref:Uncharacterized protein n=1 Tax=Timema bartmani TaxID=61472 RepID=A0A7R9F7V8_9NEOP|nr:unnamed protein product [Timema bartmani]
MASLLFKLAVLLVVKFVTPLQATRIVFPSNFYSLSVGGQSQEVKLRPTSVSGKQNDLLGHAIDGSRYRSTTIGSPISSTITNVLTNELSSLGDPNHEIVPSTTLEHNRVKPIKEKYGPDSDSIAFGTDSLSTNSAGTAASTSIPRPPDNALAPVERDVSQSPPKRDHADTAPSRCVWSIVSCCVPGSAEVRYRCFELLGCDGAFWGSSPCSHDFGWAAIAAITKFYGVGTTGD